MKAYVLVYAVYFKEKAPRLKASGSDTSIDWELNRDFIGEREETLNLGL